MSQVREFFKQLVGDGTVHPKDLSRDYQLVQSQVQDLAPEGISDTDRWQMEINQMMASNNPVLQKIAMNQMLSQRTAANRPPPTTTDPEGVKYAKALGFRPGTPEFNNYVMQYTDKSRQQTSPEAVRLAVALGYKPGSEEYNSFIERYAFRGQGNDMSSYGRTAVDAGYTPGTQEYYDYVQYLADPNKKRTYQPKVIERGHVDDFMVNPKMVNEFEKIFGRPDLMVGQDLMTASPFMIAKPDDNTGYRSSARSMISDFRNTLFNEETGIYNEPFWHTPGALGLAMAQVTSGIKDILQDDPRYKAYTDARAGSASIISRSLGEKGALSDKDILRALALLPNISGARMEMIDRPETANLKLQYLERILEMETKEEIEQALTGLEQMGVIDSERIKAAEEEFGHLLDEDGGEDTPGGDWK